MDFWESNFSNSFWDAWAFMEGSSYMTALFIFVVSTALLYVGGHKWKIRKLLWDGLKGALITAFAFVLVFIFCFLFISPSQIYKGQQSQIQSLEHTATPSWRSNSFAGTPWREVVNR
jgi:hypothetical protein